MTLRRTVAAVLLLALALLAVAGVWRWRADARRAHLAEVRAALADAQAYPRRLAGEHDAAVAEGERLGRAIEEVDLGVGTRTAEARRSTAMRRQTERIYRILTLRRRSAPLAAELEPPRPPGEDEDQ